jgi:pimeloyl-ACP methyl ester carboxylesterase
VPVEAAEAIARGVPNAELHLFENSGHMTFVEENEAYVRVVRDFLTRHTALITRTSPPGTSQLL